MLSANYERTMEHSYVSFKINEYRKTFEEEMLKNSIPGVLPFQLDRQDERVCFSYNITQKLELMEYIQQTPLEGSLICKLLNHLILNIKAAREYLLEADNFVIDQNYIYVGDGGETFWLCYYIGYQQPVREQLNHLFEVWMKQIDYDDHKTVKLVYELYHLSRMETCTYDQILEILAKEAKEWELPLSNKCGDRRNASFFMDEEITKVGSNQSELKKQKQEGIVAMVEEVSGEREELYYPISCYTLMAASISAGAVALCLILKTALLQTKAGQIDAMKVLCFVLISLVVECLIGRTLFRPERKLSRMRKEVNYVSIHDDERFASKEQLAHKLEGIDSDKKHLSQMELREVQQNENESYDKYKVEKEKSQICPEEAGTQMLLGEEETKMLLGEEKTQLLRQTKRLLLQSQQINAETLEVIAEETVLGSSIRQSDMLIQYPTISRTHARVLYRDNTFYLEDLSSTNGTFYNGRRLLPGEQQELSTNDLVQFAEYTYEVSIQMD